MYVTDIIKVYATQDGHKYVGEPAVNQIIFEQELQLVKPAHIIVSGKSALTRLNTFYNPGTYPIQPIMLNHPAAWVGDKNYYELFTAATNDGSR